MKNKPSDLINVAGHLLEGENNPLKNYLDLPHWKAHTRIALKCNLTRYFRMIDATPCTYFSPDKVMRDYENDVTLFVNQLIAKGNAPGTAHSALSSLNQFLIENDIELSTKFMKRLRRRMGSGHRIVDDKIPTKNELRAILQFSDVKMRAIILMLLSSGMRVGELLQLTWDDIDFNAKPVLIRLSERITKTKTARICFISEEAKEAVLVWKKTWQAWCKAHGRKSFYKPGSNRYNQWKKDYDANAVFKSCYATTSASWNNILDKAGFGNRCKRTKIIQRHIHMLRAYFRTTLSKAIPLDAVEELMGHAGYLTTAYRKTSVEDLAKLYQSGVHVLHVYSAIVADENLRVEFDQLKEDYEYLKRQMDRLMGDRIEELSKKKTE